MCQYDGGDCKDPTANVSTEIDKIIDASSGTWSKSMSYYNGIFNDIYGFERRWSIYHAPHTIDKAVMERFVDKFFKYVNRTSANKFRTNHDNQLAFNYAYFVIGEQSKYPLETYFHELDSNHDFQLSFGNETLLFKRVSILFLLQMNYTPYSQPKRISKTQFARAKRTLHYITSNVAKN